MKKLLGLFAFSLALAPALRAELKLPAIIGDRMVLQQKQANAIWGWDTPGMKITVAFAGQNYSAAAGNDGRWLVKLAPLPANAAPQTLTIIGSVKRELSDVLIGEVWLCSGQSNMELPLAATRDGARVVARSANPEIRLFLVRRSLSATPQEDVKANWAACGPESAGRFSAAAYYFGRALQEKLKVPVGLIDSSVGGAAIQQWTGDGASQALYRDGKYAVGKDHLKLGGGMSHLYNGMIAPLPPFSIRGVIWYQGESNSGDVAVYDEMMRVLVAGWRKAWGGQPFPFYFTQLAPRDYKGVGSGRPLMTEAMTKALDIPNSGMAFTCDYGRKDNTHPLDKQPVGDRLARLALHDTYGLTEVVCWGPMYRACHIAGARVKVQFAHAEGGLKSSNGKPLTFFEVAGADNVYHKAHAEIVGPDSVMVWSEAVAEPKQVRFAWHDVAMSNLANGAGLPALCFRTDPKCPPPLKYDWPADMGGLD